MFLLKSSNNYYPNNTITINTNRSILSPICVSKNSDHTSSHKTITNSSNHTINMKPGDTVFDSNGNPIGILDEYMNVIRNNGAINIMRPMAPMGVNIPNLNIHIQCQNKINTVSVSEINKQIDKQHKTITQETMKRGRHIPSNQKPFICKICGKGYKYLCNYRSHCKIHTDDAFVCQYCNKKFGRKSNYKEHVRIHTGEAPYKCEVCNRKFKQHHGWKDHMRVHTGEKPYLCSLCGKRFTVGHNLNVHMRIHTGERPYTCNICKKSYRQKSAYNSHIKRHQKINVTGKQSDNCSV
eukprot:545559_1